MNEKNNRLKCKLIIQSFAPLYFLVLIKYFDYHILVNGKKFFQGLFHGDFSVLLKVYGNQYFGVFLISVLSISWIISAVIAFWQFKEVQMSGFIDAGDKIEIDEQLTDSGVTFFMTFVFPLLLDDLTTIRGFVLFMGILILVFLLLWKTNLYYQNPILTILGYRVYRINFLEETGRNYNLKYIAISKEALDASKIVKWKYIADDVLLVYNKNK